MISSLINAFISLFVIDVVRRLYQNKQFTNQLKVKFLEEDIKKISSIDVRLSELASKRLFICETLILELKHNYKEAILYDNVFRKEYRDIVKEWNINLSVLNVDFSHVNMYNFAKVYLDGGDESIQYNFRTAHQLINSYISSDIHCISELDKAINYLNKVKKIKAKLSKQLTNKIAEKKKKY